MSEFMVDNLGIELEDLAVNAKTLTPAQKSKLRWSVAGRFCMWFVAVFSVFGIAVLTGLELDELVTSPVGLSLLAVSTGTGLIASVLRYFSFNRKLLAEKNAQLQEILLQLDVHFKAVIEKTHQIQNENSGKLTPNNLGFFNRFNIKPVLRASITKQELPVEVLWKEAQRIDDLGIRAGLLLKILKAGNDNQAQQKIAKQVQEKLENQKTENETQISNQGRIWRVTPHRFATYQALAEGKLTPENKSSLRRTATGSFFNALLAALGIPGVTFLAFAKGAAAFALFTALGPVGWGIIAGSVVIAGIVAARKYHLSRRREELIEEAQSSAERECNFNRIEHQYLANSFKPDEQYQDGINIINKHTHIKAVWNSLQTNFSNNTKNKKQLAAKAAVEADLLKDLKDVKNGRMLFSVFYKKWPADFGKQLQKKGIAKPAVNEFDPENLGIKAEDLATDTKTLNTTEKKKLFWSVLGRYSMWSAATFSVFGVSFTSQMELDDLIDTPAGGGLLGFSILTGVVGAVFRFISYKQTLLNDRTLRCQEYLLKLDEYYQQQEELLKNNQSPKLEVKSVAPLWEKTQKIDDAAVRAKLQIDFLENETTPKILENIIDAAIIKQDEEITQQNLKQGLKTPLSPLRYETYSALSQGRMTPENLSSLRRTTAGVFFNSMLTTLGIPGATFLTLKGAALFTGFALLGPIGWGILAGALVISIGVAARKYYLCKKREELLRDAQDNAGDQSNFNKLEYSRLINILKGPEYQKGVGTKLEVIKKAWESIQSMDTLKADKKQFAAKACVESDFLSDLKNLKNFKNQTIGFEKFNNKWKDFNPGFIKGEEVKPAKTVTPVVVKSVVHNSDAPKTKLYGSPIKGAAKTAKAVNIGEKPVNDVTPEVTTAKAPKVC